MTTERVHPAGGALVDGDMPRLPDPPATSAIQLAPPILSSPPPTSEPVPSMLGVAPGSQAWTIETMQEVHRATNQQLRSGRPGGPWWRRVLLIGGTVVLGALLLTVAVFVAQGALDRLDGPQLPQFSAERPDYGTSVYEYTERDGDGVDASAIVRSNGSLTHAHMDLTVDGERTEIRRTPAGSFVFVDGSWVEIDEDAAMTEMIDTGTRVPIFSDIVPDEARALTTVVDSEEVDLDGLQVTRVDLVLDHERFEELAPDAYADWVLLVGEPESVDDTQRISGVHLAVWADDRGVVWRWASRSDVSTSFVEGELVRLDDEPFAVASPFALG